MTNVSFKISCPDIDNSIDCVGYSQFTAYHTKRLEDGVVKKEGEVSEANTHSQIGIIMNALELEEWYNSVQLYIDGHNEDVINGKVTRTVKFIMTDMDERFAFTYEKYINDVLVERGTGFYKDLVNEDERSAWVDSAIEYKKANGIECDTDKMMSLIDDIKAKIDNLDSELPELNLTDIPLIEIAITNLIADPCNFISSVMRAGAVNISRINGIPDPTEVANYLVKLLKDNAERAITSVTRAQEPVVKMAFTPVIDFDESAMLQHMRELDAEHEEFLKTHSDAFASFEVCEYNFGYKDTFIPSKDNPPTKGGAEDYIDDFDDDFEDDYTTRDMVVDSVGYTIGTGKRAEVIRALGFSEHPTESECYSKMKKIELEAYPGRTVRIHRELEKEVQAIFHGLKRAGVVLTEKLGSYYYRPIKNKKEPNSKKLSMHSFGCAIDLNYDLNPFISDGKPLASGDDTARGIVRTVNSPIVKVFKANGWGWGGTYGDYMHFSKANGW